MFQTIKSKILAILIPIILISTLASYFINMDIISDIIESETETKIAFFDKIKTTEIEKITSNLESISISLASTVSANYQTAKLEEYSSTLQLIMQSSPEIYGIAIVLEPYTLGVDVPYSATYVQWADGELITTVDYEQGKYNFYGRDYYEQAKESDTLTFTKPRADSITGEPLLISTLPIKDENGNYIGCVLAKVTLKYIDQALKLFTDDSSMLYILDGNGDFIASDSEIDIEDRRSIYDYDIKNSLIEHILEEETGNIELDLNNIRYTAYYDTMDEFGWKIIYVVTNESVHQPFLKASINYILLALLFILIVVLAILRLMRKYIETPIHILMEEYKKISDNILDTETPAALLNSKDEIGQLSSGFDHMKYRLKQYQVDLKDNITYANSILSAIPDTVFILDYQGNVIDVRGQNTSVILDITKYKDKNIREFINESSANEMMEHIQQVIGTEDILEQEFSFISGGQEEVYDIRYSDSPPEKIIAVCRNLSEFQKQLNTINYLSNFDQLTGLTNRANFRKYANKLIDKQQFPFSFIAADINSIRLVNSSFGYKVGDLFIKEFSQVLANTEFEGKVLGYLSGGLFAIILENSGEKEADQFIRLVKEECKNHFIKNINVSAAFGYYCMRNDLNTLDYAMDQAENMLAENKRTEYSNTHNETLEIINRTLQAKSEREQLHSLRVAELCKEFAIALNFSEKDQNEMYSAGLMHDIGKIGVSENILDKPGKLLDAEFHKIRLHPEIGYKILQASRNMKSTSDIIIAHHERYDGLGYPHGLKGEEISLKSRMLCIIDSYDAMVSDREYRKGMSKEQAIIELQNCAGKQFDEELTKIFIQQVLR